MGKSEEIDLVPVKKKSKLSLILVVLLVLMSGAAGFFGWRYFTSPANTAAQAKATEGAHEEGSDEPAEGSEAAGEEEHAAPAHEGDKAAQSTVLNFEPFLVNLADKDASRYLRITMKFQVASRSAAEKIAGAEVLTSQMRDSILGTLSSKNSDQIVTREGKELLKTELADKLNAFLPGKPIKAVFFTEFVVQL